MNPKHLFGISKKIESILSDREYRTIAEGYDFSGYKRIYHIHIRKTGGTSLNHAFLKLSGENSQNLYENLANKSDHCLVSGNKVYVGWNVRYINRGSYFYGFSHAPLHTLKLPEKTFTVTCFRDPVKRVISHYNMLMDYKVNKIDHPCMKLEGKWLGKTFDDFIEKIPPESLCNQLFMFSTQSNIDEALEQVSGLSHYFFTESFARGIDELNRKVGLQLKVQHIRMSSSNYEIPDSSINNLREKLEKEYAFINQLYKLKKY